MGENSEISWTHHTMNPWWGCSIVSPGCTNCYASTFSERVGHGKRLPLIWGKNTERRFMSDAYWKAPLKWNRDAAAEGVRKRVFCASMADVFEDREDLVAPRERLFKLITDTPQLDWLLLTKRPEDMVRLAKPFWPGTWPLNVWAGTTVEDQKRAHQRMPKLLEVPAAVRFLSCEPLLGPVYLDLMAPWTKGISWVIAGGESGTEARPMNIAWPRALRAECQNANVPFHFKQWGEHASGGERIGKKAAGRLLDGRAWDEFPVGLLP